MPAKGTLRANRVADIEGEVIGYMPERFVMLYYSLVSAGLKMPGSSMDREVLLAGEAGRGKHGRQEGGSSGGLKNEQALKDKRKIDQKLRMLVREVAEGKSSGNTTRDRCPECQTFTSGKYCSGCGIELGTLRGVAKKEGGRMGVTVEDFCLFMQHVDPSILNQYLKMVLGGQEGEHLAGVVRDRLRVRDEGSRGRRGAGVPRLEEGDILRLKLRLEQVEGGAGETGVVTPRLR